MLQIHSDIKTKEYFDTLCKNSLNRADGNSHLVSSTLFLPVKISRTAISDDYSAVVFPHSKFYAQMMQNRKKF